MKDVMTLQRLLVVADAERADAQGAVDMASAKLVFTTENLTAAREAVKEGAATLIAASDAWVKARESFRADWTTLGTVTKKRRTVLKELKRATDPVDIEAAAIEAVAFAARIAKSAAKAVARAEGARAVIAKAA